MAGLNPQVIGTAMTAGFAGSYARQPDMIVNTRTAGGSAAIPFGAPLVYSGGTVVQMGADAVAAQFVGVAGREIKSSLTYLEQSPGEYNPGDPVSVFQRGSIQVKCQRGTTALGGAVYVRTTYNGTYSSAQVGGFESEDDSGNVVQLTNAQWGGPPDANGIAELVILTRLNA
ncbi:structural cement protein Gp24 [Flavonifractor sp. An306]|uniref:structural cement protein Gp24 n=1 Tax=Flavonifractor sp. An306 TaxID=1965629 RepID=UPI00174C041D|nr:hypothetical protein [Flavonifractor sp. An306]